MGELHFKMSMSMDGFVAGPNGESDWIFSTTDPKSDAWEVAIFDQVGLHLMGSKTYADMVAWWPYSNEVFAPAMNDVPKAIFTRKGAAHIKQLSTPDPQKRSASLQAADAALQNSGGRKREPDPKVLKMWQEPYVASGPIADEVEKLKREYDKPIIAHGGAGFARSLIATGLVDKFFLLIHPVILGKGLPIFSDVDKPLSLALESSTSFPKGATGQVYRPA